MATALTCTPDVAKNARPSRTCETARAAGPAWTDDFTGRSDCQSFRRSKRPHAAGTGATTHHSTASGMERACSKVRPRRRFASCDTQHGTIADCESSPCLPAAALLALTSTAFIYQAVVQQRSTAPSTSIQQINSGVATSARPLRVKPNEFPSITVTSAPEPMRGSVFDELGPKGLRRRRP